MCMRIQRPIIAREKHSLYGNAFEMTQHQQHLYECVQPLQGRITFTDNRHDEYDKEYRNNFTFTKRDAISKTEQGDSIFSRLESLLLGFVLMIFGIVIFLWIAFKDQHAMNKVYLSKFVVGTGGSYTIEDAGFTKPVECLTTALLLVTTSLLVGWQSNRGIKRLENWTRNILLSMIAIFQILAFSIHASTFGDGTSMSFTNWGVLGLHIASFALTILIFVYLASLPEKRPDKLFETENTFWLCVVEDLNTIVCYVLIYRACDSQVSIHDDTATFFDVVCIVTIGFLQHIANILMIFHGYIHACGKATADNINNIGRTRVLIFFMIGVVTVFLYLHITPTYTEYPAGVPFEISRSLALIAFISLNSIHSLWYELQGAKTKTVMQGGNAQQTTPDWETSPTWKLMTTAFIAAGSGVLLVQFVWQYRNQDIFNVLNPTS